VNTWKVILATVVIFAAGVLTGGLTVRLKNRAEFRGAAPSAAPPVLQRLEFLRRAQDELRLSPDQRERVEVILRESQERMTTVWERVAPEARLEFGRVRDRIRDVLTPEQRARFEQLLKERRKAGEPRRARESWPGEERREGPQFRGAPPPAEPPPRAPRPGRP